MRLTPPKKITFWISIIVAIVGLVLYALAHGSVIKLIWLDPLGVILLAAAFLLLTLGLMLKGL